MLGDEHVAQGVGLISGDEGENRVALSKYGVAAYEHSLVVPDDPDDVCLGREAEFTDACSDDRGPLGEDALDDFDVALGECADRDELVHRNLLVKQAEDERGGADSLVDADLLKDDLVSWVVHSGEDALDLPDDLGHLADNHVVLIFTGNFDDAIGALESGVLLGGHFAAVANENILFAKVLGEADRGAGVALQHEDFVAAGQEFFGKVKTDISTADKDHIH